MRTHSRQTGRRRSSAARFQNTTPESLRPSRLVALVREDLGNGPAENCSTPHRPLSRRQGSCDNPVQFASGVQPDLVQHPREIHHAASHFFWALWIIRHAKVIAASLRARNCSGVIPANMRADCARVRN
jgi:hypothetical protein